MSLELSDNEQRVYEQFANHLRDYFSGHTLTAYDAPTTRVAEYFKQFAVIEITPGPKRALWTYITVGLWAVPTTDGAHMELMLLAPDQDQAHIALLGMLAWYHAHGNGHLGLGHTLAIGTPWRAGSLCDHLLLSHSYPYGWNFEHCPIDSSLTIHIWWVLPITAAERAYKQEYGLEALEQQFETARLHYWDGDRASVV